MSDNDEWQQYREHYSRANERLYQYLFRASGAGGVVGLAFLVVGEGQETAASVFAAVAVAFAAVTSILAIRGVSRTERLLWAILDLNPSGDLDMEISHETEIRNKTDEANKKSKRENLLAVVSLGLAYTCLAGCGIAVAFVNA